MQLNQIGLTLFRLVELDEVKRDKIFGEAASYRNNGETKRTINERVGWRLGLDPFGDYFSEEEMATLTTDDLKVYLRQYAFRVQLPKIVRLINKWLIQTLTKRMHHIALYNLRVDLPLRVQKLTLKILSFTMWHLCCYWCLIYEN